MSPRGAERLRQVLLAGLVCLSVVLGLWIAWVEMPLAQQALPIPGLAENGSPTRDYLYGFECGVRYGLLARILHHGEDSIAELVKAAKYYHWEAVVKRNNPHAMDCSGTTTGEK